MSISAAKSRVNQVKEYFESGRLGYIEDTIAAGEKFLDGLPDGETAPIRAELAALRAQLAAMPTDEETRNLSAARGKIRQARSQIADSYYVGWEGTIEVAREHLNKVREIHRGPVAEELAEMEAEAAARRAKEAPKPAPAPAPAAVPVPVAAPAAVPVPVVAVPAPVPLAAASAPVAAAPAVDPNALTDDDRMTLSRARSKLVGARSAVESRRTENLEPILEEVAAMLAPLPAQATAAMRAEIIELRNEGAAVDAAERNRRARSELDRHLRSATGDIETLAFSRSSSSLDHVASRLGDADILAGLSSDEVADYRNRVAEGRVAVAAGLKADALDRANPILAEVEALVATDPIAGLPQHEAYKVLSKIDSLRIRTLDKLRPIPEGDNDVAAIMARLTRVQQEVDKASAAWGKAELDSQVANTWSAIAADVAGWDAEQPTADVSHLYEPELPKTRLAIQRIRYLLADPETQRIRAEHQNDPAIDGPYQEAERVLASAAARLNAEYMRILAAAEQLETPLNRFILDRPALLAYGAESALGGTIFAEAAAARARRLDEKWKTEVAAIMAARQELFDKLAAEAEVAWPAIRDATGAVEFDPSTVQPGTVIRLDDVYNRAGWDYGSRAYSFAACVNGTVIGGWYEAEVIAALEHAWYEQKLDVSDRFRWDLVGVVEGPAKIGERTTVTLRDARSGLEIGKIEEWPAIDCLKIRIIALHAGPVAVGPAR